ncbi:MAG: hypothetical protein KatS3mg127_1394 [Silanimonas sp.]|nr:MAG: hypothetical protein KatS3mg127_1394 [Silanimonas sp.]
MEFLYALGGVIALLLGTDSATKGLSGALQQAGATPLAAALVLVFAGYALPGLALGLGAWVWQDAQAAATALHGASLGTLGLGTGGLLLGTGVVLRGRPWRMLDGDRAQAELVEFAVSRPGWGLNGIRLVFGALLLALGARGVLAAAPALTGVAGLDAGTALLVTAALCSGFVVAVVASFNARFGDAAAAFAATGGAGFVLIVLAGAAALLLALPSLELRLLAHPLVQGLALLALWAGLAKPARAIGRPAGTALLLAMGALLVAAALLR